MQRSLALPTPRHGLRGALTAATLISLTACGAVPGPTDGDLADATLGHVHGLGVDPADGQLYAASHTGVVRIDDDGSAVRVADRRQDTMAFAVTGPGTFLGSGHPDPREDLPTHLGLIESTDAAETWEPVSLQGEVDFHALEVAGEQVYGFDAVTGRLLVTTDREEWSDVATTTVLDLAWSGEDDGTVWATTGDGLVAYDAEGGSSAADGAPGVVLIDSPRPGRLAGVTPDGEVFSTDDPVAGPWQQADGDVPGTPEAFEATPDGWYVATRAGIHRSTDGGASWDLVHDAAEGVR